MATYIQQTFKILLPILLGFGILYWMYRDFDFKLVRDVVCGEMDWAWMLLSLPFGVLAQVFRGIRWKQELEPVNENPRTSVAINAVFASYAASLIIPRIGEFTRCGILKKHDGVSFTKALGTVITERVVDTVIILIITALTIMAHISLFGSFFDLTGTNVRQFLHRFSSTGYIVTMICMVAVLLLLAALGRRLLFFNKVKQTLGNLWSGIATIRSISRPFTFVSLSLLIWLSYFLHYYLTFFCFNETSSLSLAAAIITFIVGSIAVIVPTPNGAGSWHFAVKTMLLLYGVTESKALYFVLIVHTVQTMLVMLLGVYASIALGLTRKKTS